ncbi:MAG TPA: gluconate 2-dehydrogenase subunit 3 family protein [Bryobacteraceae bacterium]|jgi:gluconate 2-dehydrogenase gamma chain
MKRREFIELSAQSVGGLLIYSLAGVPMVVNARGGRLKVALRFFTRQEAKVIVAACERIFPANESGPGATQAGAMVYIDRQLAGPYGCDKYRYTRPPFVGSVPEAGYQGNANPRETYRMGIQKLGMDFFELDAAQQDERLTALEKSHFFQLLRQHTIEGMFCDPMHGGNANLIGWQMLGYPGPQMSYREQVGRYNGVAYRVKPQSLEQILGYPVKPWEDEENC